MIVDDLRVADDTKLEYRGSRLTRALRPGALQIQTRTVVHTTHRITLSKVT